VFVFLLLYIIIFPVLLLLGTFSKCTYDQNNERQQTLYRVASSVLTRFIIISSFCTCSTHSVTHIVYHI